MTIEGGQTGLEQLRDTAHANCVVCAAGKADGLGLAFSLDGDGGVVAEFGCDAAFEGYAGMVHGGVAASLVDGAMTNCLFAHGSAAVTAELKVRFRHPLMIGETAVVRGWIDRSSPPLYLMKADIHQNGQRKVTATGKFMTQPHLSVPRSAADGNGRKA